MVCKRFLIKAFLKEQGKKSTPTSEHKLSWGQWLVVTFNFLSGFRHFANENFS